MFYLLITIKELTQVSLTFLALSLTQNLKIKESVKKELKKISPHNYTGV